ncbi:MAG: HlyD family secretion protein [Lentisphaeria bacterium]
MSSIIASEQSLPFTYSIRIRAFTEKSEKINNPVRWLPLETVIPDGTYVQAGDVVATFSSEETANDLIALKLRQAVIDANVDRRLAEIDSNTVDLTDQMGTLQDKLSALEARLERLRSEPNPDDVRIAEGRLRVANLNLEASRKDFAKAEDRFRRAMISRAELDNYEKDLREKEVRARFATQELDVTKNPPTLPNDIKRAEIDIENTKLEIDKLAFEMSEQEEISVIQKDAARIHQRRNQKEIADKEKDLQHTSVKAPIAGFISHNRVANSELIPGLKMWDNFAFMEIPEIATIGFRGVLHESVRKHFKEGDEVRIRVNGRYGDVISGRLKSISTLSHDLAEKEESGGGDVKSIGVKVFDVTITTTAPLPWLRPGMRGEAELLASEPITGPTLPLQYVMQQDGKSFVAENGLYREVSGTVVGSFFVLDDPSWLNREVTARGVFPVRKDDEGKEEKRLSASGELLPVRSTDILVPDIGRWPWPKITWLIPEESMVKAGDVVAKLDPEEREKRISNISANYTEVESRCNELEKKIEITRRNGEFRQSNAGNNLATVRISSEETLNFVPPLPVFRNEMTLELAKIQLAATQRRLDRELGKKNPTMSPAELARLKRTLRRHTLKVEQAELNLSKSREGSTRIAKSRAKLNLEDAEAGLESTAKSVHFDNLSIRREYDRNKQHLQQIDRRLQREIVRRDNHVITAPADGLICYNKVYNGNNMAKVALGNTVGPRFNILSIPDVSEMEIKVEVPEKYYGDILPGLEVEVRIPSLGEARLAGTVSKVDLLFSNRGKKDSQLGLYSSHEPLGEVTFAVRITVKTGHDRLKPGLISEVFFPFQKR